MGVASHPSGKLGPDLVNLSFSAGHQAGMQGPSIGVWGDWATRVWRMSSAQEAAVASLSCGPSHLFPAGQVGQELRHSCKQLMWTSHVGVHSPDPSTPLSD